MAGDFAHRCWMAIRGCERILSGVRPVSMPEQLATLTALIGDGGSNGAPLPADDDGGASLAVEDGGRASSTVEDDGRAIRPDAYGDGPVMWLEARVAELLGKPAAVFFPTGTMAQQVALRCWAERTANPTVALHPLSHLEVHERRAFVTLSGLRGVWPTREPRPPTAEEVTNLDEPFGKLLLELPLRDAGYLLPTWDELVAVVDAARARGARVHADGARLWETTAHFGQDLPTIAGLLDSVYVSFYKTLGGISGAGLAGPTDLVAQARAWRHRYGGTAFQQWPAALSAMAGLDRVLPRLESYVAHARMVAATLAALPGARVLPSPPHTHQFQLWLPHPADALNDAALSLAVAERTWFVGGWSDRPPTGFAVTEVTVAEPALELTEADVTAIGTAFLARLQREGDVRPRASVLS
jgi:threonine aldolase